MNSISRKKIVIVGGVAGGASCAARCRRLDESAEIIVIDRGPYVSFANCGLPYYVGDVIKDEAKLLVANAALFQERFNIEVRTHNEALAIDRAAQEIEVKELSTGRTYRERYDALVLSPGAAAFRPPLPGVDSPGIFVLRTIPDSRKIRAWIREKNAKSAVIVGAGFIGLEMAENLAHRGLSITVVEMLNQVMPPLDPEMARPVQEHLEKHGVKVALGNAVAGFESRNGQILVNTKSGARHPGDLVILAMGVRPETGLAKSAGLELGKRGGIRVDEQCDERSARLGGRGRRRGKRRGHGPMGRDSTSRSREPPGTHRGGFNLRTRLAVPRRAGDRDLRRVWFASCKYGSRREEPPRAGISDYEKVYLHPGHHVSYFPGAKPINIKLIFRKSDGRVLGAQAVGEVDVDKRIDVIATAIQLGGTVFDLEEAELCYAPQFGAAKDPVNYAGMIATNHLRGDLPLADWKQLNAHSVSIVDVRDPDEFENGHVPGAINLPLHQIRQRLDELPRDREVWLYCGVGQRAYYATRVLMQNGFRVKNLPGGFRTYSLIAAASKVH